MGKIISKRQEDVGRIMQVEIQKVGMFMISDQDIEMNTGLMRTVALTQVEQPKFSTCASYFFIYEVPTICSK